MSDLPTIASKPVVLALNDSLPKPSVRLLGVESLTGITAALELVTAMGETTLSLVGEGVEPDRFDFPLSVNDVSITNAVAYWRTYATITVAGEGTYSLPAFPIAVVDYAALWASPTDVAALVGPGFSNEDVVLAILAAEGAVRAWVATPVSSPAPDRVRRATTLLAARALSAPSESGTVLSETIGDYSVRYADPGQSSGLVIDGEIAALLSPWADHTFSSYIGPDDIVTGFFGSSLYSVDSE